MSDKFFLDTNIFIYSFDRSQPDKKSKAMALIAEALQNREGLISTQVIQEFLNVATRKFSVPLGAEDCKEYLAKVLYPLCQVYPDLALFQYSLDIQQKNRYSFYDSLILAGALQAGCSILYSEDLHSGQQIGGLQIVNPFTVTTTP